MTVLFTSTLIRVRPCAMHVSIPAHTIQEGGRTFAELVRGDDCYSNFDTPRPPAIEMGEEEWAVQQESLKRLNGILLDSASQQIKVIGHRTYP